MRNSNRTQLSTGSAGQLQKKELEEVFEMKSITTIKDSGKKETVIQNSDVAMTGRIALKKIPMYKVAANKGVFRTIRKQKLLIEGRGEISKKESIKKQTRPSNQRRPQQV